MKETIEFKLLVKDVNEEITEIFFESDEKGETQIIKEQNIGKIFDSISDFQKWCQNEFKLKDEIDRWSVIDNRIIYTCLESNHCLEATPEEQLRWKEGAERLWTVEYKFGVDIIHPSETTDDKIRNWTGFKK